MNIAKILAQDSFLRKEVILSLDRKGINSFSDPIVYSILSGENINLDVIEEPELKVIALARQNASWDKIEKIVNNELYKIKHLQLLRKLLQNRGHYFWYSHTKDNKTLAFNLIYNKYLDFRSLMDLEQFLIRNKNLLAQMTHDISLNKWDMDSVLPYIKGVTTLDLSGCDLTNMPDLSEHRNIKTLILNGNPIQDINPVINIPSLETLYLCDTDVTDATPLSALENFRHLYLSGFKGDLADLPDLKELSLLDPPQNDWSFITKMKTLEEISLNRCGVEDISLILNPNLVSLTVKEDNISDISSLKELGNISNLNLESNNISDISVVSHLNNLLCLDISYNNISDIRPLTDLNLQSLIISNNPINNINLLSSLENLRILYLDRSNVSDISFMLNLKNLRRLSMNDNNISDITPLTNKDLEMLSIGNNPITNFAPLATLSKLKYLSLTNFTLKDNLDFLYLKTLKRVGTKEKITNPVKNMLKSEFPFSRIGSHYVEFCR